MTADILSSIFASDAETEGPIILYANITLTETLIKLLTFEVMTFDNIHILHWR